MARRRNVRPTDGELAILRVLWDQGASTVRDVLDTLEKAKPTGYTTVLKLMQIMADKGLVRRDESQRTHVYEPFFSEEQTQGVFLKDMIDKAFGGSAHTLVMQALSSKKASREEIVELREFLDDMENRAK